MTGKLGGNYPENQPFSLAWTLCPFAKSVFNKIADFLDLNFVHRNFVLNFVVLYRLLQKYIWFWVIISIYAYELWFSCLQDNINFIVSISIIIWIRVLLQILWHIRLQDIYPMGGACSRKRDQLDNEEILHRGVSAKYNKSLSSKWLMTSLYRPPLDNHRGTGKCPSLMELCAYKIREVCCSCIMLIEYLNSLFLDWSPSFLCKQDIDRYSTFSMLPRDISQQIFDELVNSRCLNDISLEAFRDCALQVTHIMKSCIWL